MHDSEDDECRPALTVRATYWSCQHDRYGEVRARDPADIAICHLPPISGQFSEPEIRGIEARTHLPRPLLLIQDAESIESDVIMVGFVKEFHEGEGRGIAAGEVCTCHAERVQRVIKEWGGFCISTVFVTKSYRPHKIECFMMHAPKHAKRVGSELEWPKILAVKLGTIEPIT